MMLMKSLWLAALALLCLNGCATAVLWEDYQAPETRAEIQQQSDSVVGFARVKPDSKQLPPNSWVMLGDSYVYVLTSSAAMDGGTYQHAKLAGLFHHSLSQAFELHALSAGGVKPSEATQLAGLPVTIKQSRPDAFSSSFCLIYPENPRLSKAQRAREQAELAGLGFRLHAAQTAVPTHMLCLVAAGTLYRKPDGLQYEHCFAQPIPVHITTHSLREIQHGGAGWRALLTPFAAAVDIVTLPVTLPLGVKAMEGMAEGMKP